MTTTSSADDRCRMETPADPAFFMPVRLFVAAVGRLWGIDEETVEDLRLVVSELASAALAGGASQLCVELVRRGRTIDLIVSPISPEALEGEPVAPGDVVHALFDRVEVGRDRVVVTLENAE